MHRTRPTLQHRTPSVCRWPPQRIATEARCRVCDWALVRSRASVTIVIHGIGVARAHVLPPPLPPPPRSGGPLQRQLTGRAPRRRRGALSERDRSVCAPHWRAGATLRMPAPSNPAPTTPDAPTRRLHATVQRDATGSVYRAVIPLTVEHPSPSACFSGGLGVARDGRGGGRRGGAEGGPRRRRLGSWHIHIFAHPLVPHSHVRTVRLTCPPARGQCQGSARGAPPAWLCVNT
jgi:hypothetical protein